MLRFFSLRYVLPALVWVFILIGIAVSYYTSRHLVLNDITEQKIVEMREQLNFLQDVFEHYLEENKNGIQGIVSSLASSPDMKYFMVVGKDDVVLASSYAGDTGNHWTKPGIDIDTHYVEHVKGKRLVEVHHADGARLISGYASVCLPETGNYVQAKQCGFVFYCLDLGYHYDLAKKSIFRGFILTLTLLSLGVIVLLFFLKKYITSRVGSIVNTLRFYSEGDNAARCKLDGHDEIVWIAETINSLLDRVDESHKKIIEREKRLEVLFQTVIDAIIIIDSNGIIRRINRAAEKMFGYPEQELTGENVKILMPEPYCSEHDQYIYNYNTSHVKKVIGIKREVDAVKKNGHVFPVDISVTEMKLGGRVMFAGIVRDITERKEFEQAMHQVNEELVETNRRLNEFASKDSLTNIFNRRSFDVHLTDELHRATRDKLPLSLLMCDIDYFKLYNDTYGHQVGDECLYKVATVIKTFFQRGGEMVARYGGEEFAVILPATDMDRARRMAEILLQAVRELDINHVASKTSDKLTISIGIGSYMPSGNVSPASSSIIRAADEGLYRAKANGRNRVELGSIIE